MEPNSKLKKAEILRGKRAFEILFEHQTSFRSRMLKFYYSTNVPSEILKSPVSVVFSVPKRIFKRAVDRNLLKRRMRKAYRLNKMDLLDYAKQSEQFLVIQFTYTSRKILPYQLIEENLLHGLNKLQKILEENNRPHIDSDI